MTNAEAITELTELFVGCCGDEEIEPTREAVRMAISALEQPDWNDLLVICANCGHTIHVAKDAQHIIRCKDCRHYVGQHRLCKGMDQYTCHMKSDDFCSRAERREDE